jgi:rubredoxin
VLDERPTVESADGDFVEFAQAGAKATGAFHCSSCGYGVTIQATLPRCPMCGGTSWEAASTPAAAPRPGV